MKTMFIKTMFTKPMLNILLAIAMTICSGAALAEDSCPALLNYTLPKLHSKEQINLCQQFKGKPLLIVNTASHCGFTRQFKGLEQLNQKYRERGLAVIGFPSDDFFQEARDEGETAGVCYKNYGVTFAMTGPIAVRGADAHPIFKSLAEQSAAPKWNFYKYVVDANGKVVAQFNSRTEPDDAALIAAIESVLPAATPAQAQAQPAATEAPQAVKQIQE
jgi:glutathione peroxidase